MTIEKIGKTCNSEKILIIFPKIWTEKAWMVSYYAE